MTSITGAAVAADSSMMTESIGCAVSDIHDLFSTYGEFLPTGNDPSIGQVGSIRYNGTAEQAGRGARLQSGIDRRAQESV